MASSLSHSGSSGFDSLLQHSVRHGGCRADAAAAVFEKQLEYLKDNNIEYIELRFLDDKNIADLTEDEVWEVKKKLERVVVNPATKQRMLVPPKMSVSFKVAPVLKDKANEK